MTLGIKMQGKKKYLIRAPLKLEDNGSLVLNAEIPEGEDLNLMTHSLNLMSPLKRKKNG